MENEKKSLVEKKPNQKMKFRNKKTFNQFSCHKTVGCFAINENREFVPVVSEKKYLHLPSKMDALQVNLNGGFEKSSIFQGYWGSDGYSVYRDAKYDYFLDWIYKNEFKKKLDSSTPTISKSNKIIAFAGNISKILMTPYNRARWTCTLSKFDGSIYLHSIKLPSSYDWDKPRLDPASKLTNIILGYHGDKFRDLVTSNEKTELPDLLYRKLNEPINNICKRFDVFEANFGDNEFLLMTEYPAWDPLTEEPCQIVVTNRSRSSSDYEVLKRTKFLEMWTRASVNGSNNFIIGFRDIYKLSNCSQYNWRSQNEDDGSVEGTLKWIEVYNKSSLELSCQNYWRPVICLTFLETVLRFFNAQIVVDDPNITYEVSWNDGLLSSKISESSPFLPKWFTERK